MPKQSRPRNAQRRRKVTKRSARRPDVLIRYRGRGDYSESREQSTLARVAALETAVRPGPKPFEDAGGVVGGRFGGGFGRRLGKLAGSAVGGLFGSGDYSTNSLFANAIIKGQEMPKFYTHARGLTVEAVECLGDVVSSSSANTFALSSYTVNAGCATTFPWLSAIANSFEQYKFESLVFGFKSTSADNNGSTQALGSVTLATDYDVTDASYANVLDMENADYANSAKCSESVVHGVECNPAERPFQLYNTRPDYPAPTSTDSRFTDFAKFQIASTGVAGTSVTLGRLYVSYRVTLYKKQINNLFGQYAKFTSTSLTRSAPFNSSTTLVTGSSLPVIASSSTLTFPYSGTWLVSGVILGTTTTTTSPTYAGTATTTHIYAAINSGATALDILFVVTSSGAQTVTVDLTPSCATISTGTWRIAQYSSTLL